MCTDSGNKTLPFSTQNHHFCFMRGLYQQPALRFGAGVQIFDLGNACPTAAVKVPQVLW